MCVDGFMFGSCCGHNTSSNLVLDHNSIASTSTNIPHETAIFQPFSTSRPHVVSATTFKTPTTTTVTDRFTTPTTTRPVVTTKRPVSDSYSGLSSNGELKLPFITANGSYFPEQHTLASSTLPSLSSTTVGSSTSSSSSSSSYYQGSSSSSPSSSYTHGSSSFFSIPTMHPPVSTTTTTTSTTTRPTTTTTTTFTTTRSTMRTTERPTTIFIDPKSTTTPQPNIPMDRDYGCGVPPLVPQMRIVGGKNASFAEFPWQVSVRRTSFFGFSSTHRCGGALLNENWIATAGHCVDDLLTSQIRVRLGEWDFSASSEKYPHVERGVVKKVRDFYYLDGGYAR
ncbi:unnamed protein product [Allacma fusca]|uniref:Peptidase S1 domain-containing protein n=1 Tax=Allacma fusca TaxID=39272 RepID=A0A8J2J6K1_9HEXA|nr:unnamed protein product [Allacma fusca]